MTSGEALNEAIALWLNSGEQRRTSDGRYQVQREGMVLVLNDNATVTPGKVSIHLDTLRELIASVLVRQPDGTYQ